MNKTMREFARNNIKVGLAKLPEKWQMRFKQMYLPDNLDADVNDVVDATPEEKLDWAMQQIQNSLEKIGKNGTNKKK